MRTLVADALRFLGLLDLHQGSGDQARMKLEESLQLARAADDRQGIAWSQIWLAKEAFARQNFTEARNLLEGGLIQATHIGDRQFIVEGMEGLAQLFVVQGNPVWGARLLGAAEMLREAMDCSIPPIERPGYEEGGMTARATLGDESFHAAWEQGRNMTPEQALSESGAVVLPNDGNPSYQGQKQLA